MPSAEEVPEPVQMVQLLAGFQLSQALYVVAKLGLCSALVDGPQTIEQLAAATGAEADVVGRLVRTLAPLGIFRTSDGRVQATSLGLTLAEGHPGSVRDVALFWMETHYAPFGELRHTAMTGEDGATAYYGKPFMEWISSTPARADLQTRAMANVTGGMRAGMFDHYSLPAGPVVADLGGADGSVLSELLAREPGRRGIVFDRPEVVPAAREALARRGLAGRVDVQSGDFFESVPPADVYVLSYIMHDWDDESCLRILRTVSQAAAPGARLVIIESVIPPGDAPHPAKLIDLTMLAMTTGRERTAEEYAALLTAAGYTLDRIVPSPSPFSFIEATLRSAGAR
jgi:O-methyltransferase domain/Dimerisation domain